MSVRREYTQCSYNTPQVADSLNELREQTTPFHSVSHSESDEEWAKEMNDPIGRSSVQYGHGREAKTSNLATAFEYDCHPLVYGWRVHGIFNLVHKISEALLQLFGRP